MPWGDRVYRGWWIVFTAFLSQFAATGSSGWVFGVLLLPMQVDLHTSRSVIVGVLLVQRLISGAAGALLGPFIDREGTRLVTAASAVVAGGCLLCLATVQAAWQPYVLWGIFGLSLPGLSTVAPVASISAWFVRKRTQAIVTYTFGGAMAGLVLAPTMAIVADQFGWRTVWAVMGLMFWAIAPVAWIAIRRKPEDLGLQPDGLAASAALTDAEPETKAGTETEGLTVAQVLRSKSFWLITLGFTLTMLPASSIFIHMSSYVQSKGFSETDGAAAVSIYGFGAVLGRFVWGYMVVRLDLRRSLVVWAFAYGLSIVFFALPASIVALYGTTVLLGITVSGSLQFRAQAFPDYFGSQIAGSLTGYAAAIATLAGAVAPLIVAYWYDLSGAYEGIFLVFAVCCVAASVAFF
ncbi:MAG TPA: MFS transporter, partial [Dehalococcoidia bacterium]|nr:MFS transporter [Dehalococcoidia bacterium]